jgi:putative sterol carrier protein
MATYPFLSEEWLAEARAIRAELDNQTPSAIPSAAQAVRINLVVTDVPFEEDTVHAHLDTSSGDIRLDLGHIDPVDLTVTLGYDVARAILVEGNPQAAMQAFMAGKIRVDGDIAKLMVLQASAPAPTAGEVAARIRSITE